MSTRGAASVVRKHGDGLAALDEERLVRARAAGASRRCPSAPAWFRAARPVPP